MTVTTFRTDLAYAAAVTADLHNLPTGRIDSSETAAHIFTTKLADLEAWLNARGGYTLASAAGGGITRWTLLTTTEPRADGTTTTVLVHALALDHEPVPDALTAVLPKNIL